MNGRAPRTLIARFKLYAGTCRLISVPTWGSVFVRAFGGWLPGEIFDLTGSCTAAFVNSVLWNLASLSVVLWLLRRPGPRRLAAA